ncbi:MAG: hypothetical protein LBB49_07010 [Gracilibacteraceae bacterium]|nr:hypothetical protein [Gracilibacteraceae bacterium]
MDEVKTLAEVKAVEEEKTAEEVKAAKEEKAAEEAISVKETEPNIEALPAVRARKFWAGVTILALNCWVALSLLIMIVKSWAASNWSWVAILCGSLCFSASLSLCAWKSIALEQREEGVEDGAA